MATEIIAGRNGFPCYRVSTPAAEAGVYRYGAHVAHWQPRGHAPVLYMSQKAVFEVGKPIRGGVPVCFPWFGPRQGGLSGPPHGWARLQDWHVEPENNGVTCRLAQDGLEMTYRIGVGAELELDFSVRNAGTTTSRFEAALHTYLAVSDVREVSITGLAGVEYIERGAETERRKQGNEPIRFAGETDRLYVNTQAACELVDPGLSRRIIVEKSGSDSTVVWNPASERARQFADLGEDEWPNFVCIETANAGDNAITLEPGQSQTMRAVIRVG